MKTSKNRRFFTTSRMQGPFFLGCLTVLFTLLAPLSIPRTHGTEAGAPAAVTPNPLATPGASDTQVFWQQRARDSLIFQSEAQIRHLRILQDYHDSGDFSRLRNALGSFCAGWESSSACFQRYRRSESRRIEEVRGGILRSETEITKLRNDIPGQGGSAIQMGGELTPVSGGREVTDDYRSFSPTTRTSVSLSSPAYVPTLAELEAIERSGRPGLNARGIGTESAENQLLSWRDRTYASEANREDFALFELVPLTASPGGAPNQAPLRRILSSGSDLQADEDLVRKVNQSLVNHQGRDTDQANAARQAGIRAIDAETRARETGSTPLETRITEEQRRAYYETRGSIIQAYQGALAPTSQPSPPPPSRATASTATTSTAAGTSSPRVETQVQNDEPQATRSAAPPTPYDDQAIGDRLPQNGNFHLYTDPSRYDTEIRDLRELDTH